MTDESTDRAELLALWRTQLQAMDEADTESLAGCFTPDAVLVHMTGYRQPLEEWMEGIRAREFVYHRVVERSVDVEVDGDTAHLVGHIVTGVTDDGSDQAWPLRVVQELSRGDGAWLCTESRVTFDGR